MGAGGIQGLIAQPKREAQRDDKKEDEKVCPACALEQDFPRAKHEKTRPEKRKILFGKQNLYRKLGVGKRASNGGGQEGRSCLVRVL